MPDTSASTSSSSPQAGQRRLKASDFWLLAPVIVVIALAAIFFITERRRNTELVGGIKLGEVFPEIKAEGWLNGEPPTKAELAGKVVVVEIWASWCLPCVRIAPKLKEYYETYHDKGVEFIGVSTEDKSKLADVENFVKEFGIPWPNGYGGEKFLQATGAEEIPAIWVIGADGRVLWNRDGTDSPENAIKAELARLAARKS